MATADLLYAAVAAAAGAAVASLLEPHEHAMKLVAAGVLAAVAVLSLLRLGNAAGRPPRSRRRTGSTGASSRSPPSTRPPSSTSSR